MSLLKEDTIANSSEDEKEVEEEQQYQPVVNLSSIDIRFIVREFESNFFHITEKNHATFESKYYYKLLKRFKKILSLSYKHDKNSHSENTNEDEVTSLTLQLNNFSIIKEDGYVENIFMTSFSDVFNNIDLFEKQFKKIFNINYDQLMEINHFIESNDKSRFFFHIEIDYYKDENVNKDKIIDFCFYTYYNEDDENSLIDNDIDLCDFYEKISSFK